MDIINTIPTILKEPKGHVLENGVVFESSYKKPSKTLRANGRGLVLSDWNIMVFPGVDADIAINAVYDNCGVGAQKFVKEHEALLRQRIIEATSKDYVVVFGYASMWATRRANIVGL